VGALHGCGAADQERVLAVGGLVGLDGEDGVAGDVLGPEGRVDGAGFEVFGEEGFGLGFGGSGCEGGGEDQREKKRLQKCAGHGGRIRLGVVGGSIPTHRKRRDKWQPTEIVI
jgi:hypothetical protein